MTGNTHSQKGFTIVEFMVATTVFSVVLIATTFAITAISRAYQRSINDSRTQAAARNVVDTVAQAVQYSGSDPAMPGSTPANVSSYCFGNRQFIYTLGRQMGSDAGDTKSAFLTRVSSCATPPDIISAAAPSDATELLSNNMRLSNFSVSEVGGGLYKVSAKVVYGDNDVLCSPAVSNCATPLTPLQAQAPDVLCLAGVSSRFCSVSDLTVTVQKRINR